MEDAAGILLDFDGPVCRLFSGYPATDIAAELRAFLGQNIVDSSAIPMSNDPLELLRWTGMHEPALISTVEDLQVMAESKAVDSTEPTRDASAVITAAVERGTPVAIVSNNSAPAIHRYLDRQQLASHVTAVVGRVPAEPQEMKPHPGPVSRAAELIGAPVRSCVVIGDSPTDIEAAQAAGARSIGYAKRPERVDELCAAGADLVIESMRVVADALVDEGR